MANHQAVVPTCLLRELDALDDYVDSLYQSLNSSLLVCLHVR
jgi:hypothetical protein